VVALIAVPVVVLNSRSAPVDMGAEPPAAPNLTPSGELTLPNGQKRVRYRSTDGETLSTEPMVVGTRQVARGSQSTYVYAYTVRSAKGSTLCFAANVDGNEINGPEQADHGAPICSPIGKPKSGYSWGMREVPVTGNVGGTYVYVMSKPADVLMLRDVNERLIVAQQKAVGAEFTVFVAYMDSKQPPKAWTVKDAADQVLQHGQ
jgi:hypothetical protein